MNGMQFIEDVMSEPVYAYDAPSENEEWPDSVHHQSWHDGWRNSH